MAKGEQRVDESGCELDVFTFCLYHGKSQLFDDGSKRYEKHATYGKDSVNICRWEAACKKAAQMQEQCTTLGHTREDGVAAQAHEGCESADQV